MHHPWGIELPGRTADSRRLQRERDQRAERQQHAHDEGEDAVRREEAAHVERPYRVVGGPGSEAVSTVSCAHRHHTNTANAPKNHHSSA